MAQDPWDWTNKVQLQQVAAPLAAMPQAQSSGAPSPVNTTGPLQQMVQQQLMNQGFKKAFADAPPVDPSKLAPVVDANPAVPGTGPQTGEFAPLSDKSASLIETSIEPIAPLESAAAIGADAATATEAATVAESGGLMEMLSQAAMMFAADGTTSVPNKAKGGK